MAKVTKKELQSAFDTILRFLDEQGVDDPKDFMDMRMSFLMEVLLFYADVEPDEQA